MFTADKESYPATSATTNAPPTADKTEIRISLVGRALRMNEKARDLARNKRTEEMAEGKEDKVAHAIEVELSGGNKSQTPKSTPTIPTTTNKNNNNNSISKTN